MLKVRNRGVKKVYIMKVRIIKIYYKVLDCVYALGNITKLHNSISASSSKLWSSALEWTLKIGHYQLLRKKIAYELNTACKFEAKHMEASLRTLNTYVETNLLLRYLF